MTHRTEHPQQTPQQLLHAALEDLRQRWAQGEQILVETYLERSPSLETDPDSVLDLIYQEMMLRQQRGEKPTVDEYVQRFPHLAEPLHMQFEVEDGLALLQTRQANSATLAPQSTATSLAEDDEVAGHRILGELGRGGMGVVYKAEHLKLQRIVALKMIRPGTYADVVELDRFQHEAQAVARLQHPHIVQIYEVGDFHGQPYFSLEFIDGPTLQTKLAAKPLPASNAAALTETLARTIHVAHQAGVVHRDLKPANVLLTKDGTPKIADFGLAKRLDQEDSRTASGQLIGTPGYMAPEQTGGNASRIGPTTDVYALGALLYEMLTGRPPFRATNVLDTLEQIRSQEPVPPSRLEPSVPRDLQTICLKCLQKDPSKRYPTAIELADDLRRLQSGRPIQARPVSTLERLWKWARRHPAATLLILLATLFLATGWWAAAALKFSAQREAAQRRRAERSFRTALQAVEEMLTEVADRELVDVPQMQPVRQRLLTKARHFYKQFLERRRNDPTIWLLAGRALCRLGEIQELLGDYSAAQQSYKESLQLLEQPPISSTQQRRQLARTYNSLGGLFKKMERPQEAATLLRRGLELRQQLANTQPSNRSQQALAQSHHDLATVLTRLPKKRDDAEHAYHRALTLQQQLAKSRPNVVDFTQDQARTLNNLGILLSNIKPAEATTHFLAAIQIQEKLVEEHPKQPTYRRQLARTRNNLAGLQQRSGKRTLSQANYSRASELLDRLVKDYPTVPAYQQELAGVLHNQGRLLEQMHKLPEATTSYERALEIRTQLVDDSPDIPAHRFKKALVMLSIANVLERQQRLAESETYAQNAVTQLRRLNSHSKRAVHQSALGTGLNQLAALLFRNEHRRHRLLSHALILTIASNAHANWLAVIRRRVRLLQARTCVNEALRWQKQAVAADARNTLYRKHCYEHAFTRLAIQIALRDGPATISAAKQLPTFRPEDKRAYLVAAEGLVKCLAFVDDDTTLTPMKRQELSDTCRQQAIAFLRLAFHKGFRTPKQLESSPSFAPLRSIPEFQNLMDEMHAAKKVRS